MKIPFINTHKKNIAILCACALLSCGSLFAKGIAKGTKPAGNMPHAGLSFIENKGQVTGQLLNPRPDIGYTLHAAGGLSIFIGSGAISYQFSKIESAEGVSPLGFLHDAENLNRGIQPSQVSMYRMDLELVGANKNAEVIPSEKQAYYENYYTVGNGVTACAYNRVTYKNVYPQIDWVLYTRDGQMKHEFIVHRGGKVSDIQLKYGGATALRLGNNGAIIAQTPQGTITEQAPYTYQPGGRAVASSFKLSGGILSYRVGSYDGELVIDPAIRWATYYGGSGSDVSRGSVADGDKKLFVCGSTASTSNIATTGAYATTYAGGTSDGFILKIDSTGTPLWATYYGGAGNDNVASVAVSNDGYLYAAGSTTSSTGIATAGAFHDTYTATAPHQEGFIVKFDNAGTRVWATYYGGNTGPTGTYLEEICVSNLGDIYFAGLSTETSGIATPGAHDTVNENGNSIIGKFRSTGERVWCTYYGANLENWRDIAVDDSGNVYMAGRTHQNVNGGTSMATPGAHRGYYMLGHTSSPGDGFLVKFDSTGTRKWGTYLGGTHDDQPNGIGLDGAGNIYICGRTWSGWGIATPGAYDVTKDTSNTNEDAFLMKFNNGGQLLWGTYYGLPATPDQFFSLSVIGFNGVYLSGITTATTGIATTDGYHTTIGGGVDAMLIKFDSSGARLYGTYYGGENNEAISRVVADGIGNYYLTGNTLSNTGIATAGAYRTTPYGAGDVFIARFADSSITADCSLSGASSVCVGSTITLSSVTSGGLWGSSNAAVATVGSASGIVSGIAAGTATISYSVSGCTSTWAITVNGAPSAGTISGPSTLCVGVSATYSNGVSGGMWASSNTAVAIVGSASGIVSAIASGTAIISYAVAGTCATGYATKTITANALPSAIGGAASVSTGSTITLSNATTGGTWGSSNTAIATVGALTGVVTGVSAGPATITYTLSTGCYSTFNIVVADIVVAPITGNLSICMDSIGVLACTTPSGISWISSDTTVATVGLTSGVVTPISPGTATITFTVVSGAYATAVVTVNALPSPIVTSIVCTGAASAFSSTPSGGTWASSNTAYATVDTAGLVTGITPGFTNITYTLPTGCRRVTEATVGAMPAAISGTLTTCVGGTTALSSTTPGCSWGSANTSVATVGSTGIVTGMAAGTATISYTHPFGCARTVEVTVNAALAANSGTPAVCVGATTTLSNPATGGTWNSSTPAKATVNATSGIVSGVSAGTANITYTLSAGCRSITLVSVSAALATIAGPANVCVGSSVTFTHAVSGGTWASSNAGLATAGSSSGIITGVAAGTPTITYTAGACSKTKTITVNGGSAAISGNTDICAGSTSVLSCATPGGTGWSSSNPAVASIGTTSGLVTAVAAGTASVTYSASSGCTSTAVVTVEALPTAISGTLTVCQGATTALASIGTTGGTWASSNPSKAAAGSSTGIVTGISGGSATITYTWVNGCKRTAVTTVSPLPTAGAIVGAGSMSVTATQTLTSSSPGGTWASSNPARATIVAGTGLMAGVAAGTVTITYTQTNGCGTASATRIFTITTSRPAVPQVGNGSVVFTAYPNPTTGSFTIEAPVTGTFSLYTIDGRLVHTFPIVETITNLTLPAGIAAGTYMCRFNGSDGASAIVKLVYEP